MATIARPAGTGASNLGAVKPIAANQDYQKLSMPDLSGGAQMRAKEFAAFGQGLAVGASTLNEVRIADEKRELLKFEAAEVGLRQRLLTDPETGLGALSGQVALDRLTGGWEASDASAKGGIAAEYAYELKQLQAQYGASMGDKGKDALTLKGTALLSSFTGTTNAAQIQAQDTVDARITGDRIAASVTKVVASVGTEDFEATLRAEAESVGITVLDPHMGMAQASGTTDKDGKERLVKDQRALLYKAAVDELIAQGDTVRALELLNRETAKGGTLEGTAVGTALQVKLATVRDGLRGKALFADIARGNPGDLEAQIKAILAHPDVPEQGLMVTELKAHNALNNLVKREQIGKEALALVQYIQRNPGIPVDPTKYPNLAQYAPRVVFEAGSRVRTAAKAASANAATAAHVASGGSVVGNSTITENLLALADSDPAQFDRLMETPQVLKQFTSVGEWSQIQAKIISTNKKRVDALAGAMDYGKVLIDLGFKKGVRSHEILKFDTKLHEAITAERERIWNAESRKATVDDLRSIIARAAVPVDAEWTGVPTLYSLTEYAKAGANHLDINKVPLDAEDDDAFRILHYIFDGKKTPKEMEAIVDELDNAGDVTLDRIAKEIPGGKAMLNLPAAERRSRDFSEAVLALGYPPEFIRTMLAKLDMNNPRPETLAELNILHRKLKRDQQGFEALFQAWAAGEYD